ncbi:MAG TPA: hypothetical protein VMH81_09810 [Bryobacteraceae bacterium]|nr:hypothetical protein [Bryobacteraceae bacterium]
MIRKSSKRHHRDESNERLLAVAMDEAFARILLTGRALEPDETPIYREQTAAFRRKFGREMGPDDPFFFDPDADTPQFRSPTDADYAIDFLARLMAEAGVDAAAIYAFKRTGGLFPSGAMPLDDRDLLEWNAAVYEYQKKLEETRNQ